MDKALRAVSRMERIQAPIVAVVGEWIRQTPGTISLGQGVVHYGPPAAAIDAVRAALGYPATSEYQPVAGLPALRERIAAKLAAENGIDVARGSRVMVTAGGNMAFMHAVMATTSPGDEVILPVPFYFNHEMAIEMAGCRAVLRAHRRSLSAARRGDRVCRDRSDARDRHHLAEQSERRGARGAGSARGQRALPRAGDLPLLRRGVRILHLRRCPSRVAGSVPGRRRAHGLVVFAIQGLRLRRLADRIHGLPRASRRRDDEESGHDPDLPDRGLTARGHRRAGDRPRVLRAPRPRARRGPRDRDLAAGVARAARARAGRRRRVLLPAQGIDRAGRAARSPSG